MDWSVSQIIQLLIIVITGLIAFTELLHDGIKNLKKEKVIKFVALIVLYPLLILMAFIQWNTNKENELKINAEKNEAIAKNEQFLKEFNKLKYPLDGLKIRYKIYLDNDSNKTFQNYLKSLDNTIKSFDRLDIFKGGYDKMRKMNISVSQDMETNICSSITFFKNSQVFPDSLKNTTLFYELNNLQLTNFFLTKPINKDSLFNLFRNCIDYDCYSKYLKRDFYINISNYYRNTYRFYHEINSSSIVKHATFELSSFDLRSTKNIESVLDFIGSQLIVQIPCATETWIPISIGIEPSTMDYHLAEMELTFTTGKSIFINNFYVFQYKDNCRIYIFEFPETEDAFFELLAKEKELYRSDDY